MSATGDNLGEATAQPGPELSAKAQSCRDALRKAADEYNQVVQAVIEDPRGAFIARLREAEERVGEAAASYALAFVEGDAEAAPDR